MKVHPFADVFPMLKGEPYAALCLDIEEHGLREPLIITSDGMLVDGRNRLSACNDVGVELKFDTLPVGTTEVEILDLIMSKNLHRRHLDNTDRALLGIEYMKRFKEATGGAGARTDLGPEGPKSEEDHRRPKSREKAAKVVGVSGTSIDRAARVIRDEPDLAEKMKAKEITVSQADEQRKQRAEGRREGTKPENKRGSVRPTTKQVTAVLSSLSGIVHSTELIDPSAYTAEDIKEFSEHVTALNVYRRKLNHMETEEII